MVSALSVTGGRWRNRSRGDSSRGPENDPLIQAAHAVPTRIDRHPRIAERLDRGNNARADVGLERLRQFVRANFNAGEIVMMTDAAHAKSKLAQRAFGTLDRPQLLTRYL